MNQAAKPAQQDAPTDAELEQSIYETAGVFVKQPGEPAEFHCRRDDLPKIARALLANYAPAQDAERERDSERYRLVRRGQHWSVIDGIGNTLRAESLDNAVDAARAQRAAQGANDGN